MKILATAKQRGSANALLPVIKELLKREHELKVYATGNEAEAAGFGGNIEYKIIKPKGDDYSGLVKGYDLVLTGLSGYKTPDSYFIRAANQNKIPVVAIQDQDQGYPKRLGYNPEEFPTIISLMNKECIDTMLNEFPPKIGIEAVKRARVTGWTAFDHYFDFKSKFSQKEREKLLKELSINPGQEVYAHFTQNLHPDSDYMKISAGTQKQKQEDYEYEKKVTQTVFEKASDLGIKMIVKPHPGEENELTPELAQKHGFIFVPAKACDTKKLILSSYSVTAGRSTVLTEACLFDKNTGGVVPGIEEKALKPFPPLELKAIPYTQSYEGIKYVLGQVSSKNKEINKKLAENRKKFSVDGKASQRLADIIESL